MYNLDLGYMNPFFSPGKKMKRGKKNESGKKWMPLLEPQAGPRPALGPQALARSYSRGARLAGHRHSQKLDGSKGFQRFSTLRHSMTSDQLLLPCFIRGSRKKTTSQERGRHYADFARFYKGSGMLFGHR